MAASPSWYKLDISKLSWGEFKRHTSAHPVSILVFLLLKLRILKPAVNAIYRLPEDFDRQSCTEGDISVDAQLAMKPVIGALVYESGFRMAAWQKSQGDVLDPTLVDNAAALLLHESSLYRAAVLYGKTQSIPPMNADSSVATPVPAPSIVLQTYVFTQFHSGLRYSITDAALYLDVPKSARVHSDMSLKPAQMLSKLQELTIQNITQGDKPVAVNCVEELRDRYNETRREELAFRLQRGTFTPATDEEVAHFRALQYDKESQQR